MIDTGSYTTILSPTLVSQLGLRTSERHLQLDTDRSRQGTYRCATVNLRVGPIARSVGILEVPLENISLAMGRPVEGAVGLDAWTGWSLHIDYPKRQVCVSREPLPAPDGQTVFSTNRGDARTQLQLPGGKTVTVTIDSGSSAFLVLPEECEREVEFRVPPRITGYAATAGQVVARRTGRLAGTVRIGRHSIKDPLVAFRPSSFGLIGEGVLKYFSLAVDYRNARVSLDRDGSDPIEMPSLRGIGAGLAKAADQWTVLYVLPGGPAESSGIRTGDVLVGINGTHVSLWAARFDGLMQTESVVDLDVVRDGARQRVQVPVKVLVE